MIEQIIIIGTGRLPCACVGICQRLPAKVACIEPENQKFSPLSSLCRKQGVPYQLLTAKAALDDLFLNIRVSTLVVSAYNIHMFPEPVLANPNLLIVNFHNSLLPKHRGRNAPTWAIFEGDAVTGVTWHRVIRRIDAGAIIARKEIPIGDRETAMELTLRTLETGSEVFADIVPDLVRGKIPEVPPTASAEGSPHRAADIPNQGVLDTGWGVRKISAFLRSLDYGKFKVFPNPKVAFQGSSFSIIGYRLRDGDHASGTRLMLDGMNLRILGDGLSIDAALAQLS